MGSQEVHTFIGPALDTAFQTSHTHGEMITPPMLVRERGTL